MVKTEKDQSKQDHPSEEQANMEESQEKGENETTGLNTEEEPD